MGHVSIGPGFPGHMVFKVVGMGQTVHSKGLALTVHKSWCFCFSLDSWVTAACPPERTSEKSPESRNFSRVAPSQGRAFFSMEPSKGQALCYCTPYIQSFGAEASCTWWFRRKGLLLTFCLPSIWLNLAALNF